MIYHSDDAYMENYMALAVSILGNCPPDIAFRRLYGSEKKRKIRNHWAEEQIQKAAEMKSSGMTWREVCDVLGIENLDNFRSCVYLRAKVKKSEPRWTPEKVRQVKQMKASGMTAAEIGKEFNVSDQCIYYALKK